MHHVIASVLCGSLVGFALGLVGGGGSILATPALLYVVGVAGPHVAIGTSAVAVSVAAFANFLSHALAGNVRWRSALLFAAVGVVGALAGSTLGKALGGEKLLLLFGLAMVVVGVYMFRSRDVAASTQNYDRRSDGAVALLALVAGLASGFFGVGGGFLIVPCLLFATQMPMLTAVGSSLLAVSAFTLTTAANYAVSGYVDWPVAAMFILGGLAGGAAGTRLAIRIGATKNRLRRILAVLIFVVAGYVSYRSLTALLA